MKLIFTLFFISLIITPNTYAASLALRESNDCPIAHPFIPESNSQDSHEEQRVIYPMDGYQINRIQISASEPTKLEIIWTPIDASWGQISANISVSSKNPQCFFSSPGFPTNTPAKQIEIRAQKPVKSLTVSFSNVPWDNEGKCPAKQICPIFVKKMDECKLHAASKACDDFIDNLHMLTSRDQCRRGFDADPVPAIWLCDEVVKSNDVLGDAMHLLKSLKSKKAQKYYKSKEFRYILDGEYAEEYDGL